MDSFSAYGLWPVVIFHSLTILFIIFCFFQPKTGRDWRTFGTVSAFVIALFTEMYGFPLTIYLLSGWLSNHYPEIDWFSHEGGHLFQQIIGWEGDPHFSPFHILSDVLIISGLVLLGFSWKVLLRAQREQSLAAAGPYGWLRHPQYAAFMLIMIGFLVQWPTLITLGMFPLLVVMYFRLARREEKEAIKEFGDEYLIYAESTPRFFPKFQRIKMFFETI